MFKIINFITLLVIAFSDASPQQGLYYDWPNPPAPGGGRSENFRRKLWSLKVLPKKQQNKLNVALSQKVLDNFYLSKINIPNHYPEQNI